MCACLWIDYNDRHAHCCGVRIRSSRTAWGTSLNAMAEIVRVSVNLTTEEIIVIIRYLLSGCNLISPPIYRLIIIVFRRRGVEIEKKKIFGSGEIRHRLLPRVWWCWSWLMTKCPFLWLANELISVNWDQCTLSHRLTRDAESTHHSFIDLGNRIAE